MRFEDYISEMKTREATFSICRFNPPTIGHIDMANRLMSMAQSRRDAFIFGTQSKDNALTEEDQIKYMRMMIPRMATNIIVDENLQSVQSIATWLDHKGYSSIRLVTSASSEGARDLKETLNKYNGDLYDFSKIRVISSPSQVIDESTMIQAALDDKFDEFQKGLPKTYLKSQELFEAVQSGLSHEV